MAIIPRRSLFSWKNVESKSDLDRLRLVLEALRRGAIGEERFFELAEMVELPAEAARLMLQSAGFSD